MLEASSEGGDCRGLLPSLRRSVPGVPLQEPLSDPVRSPRGGAGPPQPSSRGEPLRRRGGSLLVPRGDRLGRCHPGPQGRREDAPSVPRCERIWVAPFRPPGAARGRPVCPPNVGAPGAAPCRSPEAVQGRPICSPPSSAGALVLAPSRTPGRAWGRPVVWGPTAPALGELMWLNVNRGGSWPRVPAPPSPPATVVAGGSCHRLPTSGKLRAVPARPPIHPFTDEVPGSVLGT